MCVTVMLAVIADSSKLPQNTSLNCKTMPKEQLPTGITARCQPKFWMANDLMKDWLLLVWNRMPRVHLRNTGMPELDAF